MSIRDIVVKAYKWSDHPGDIENYIKRELEKMCSDYSVKVSVDTRLWMVEYKIECDNKKYYAIFTLRIEELEEVEEW
jgi:hypothetical protein